MIGDIDEKNIRSDIYVEKSCFPEGMIWKFWVFHIFEKLGKG
jgi:hypothetical protein